MLYKADSHPEFLYSHILHLSKNISYQNDGVSIRIVI